MLVFLIEASEKTSILLSLLIMDYTDFITIDPNIRFGKPCVKSTRITVYDVLGWLACGMKNEKIISDYPELTEDAIRACLAFAADREHKFNIAS